MLISVPEDLVLVDSVLTTSEVHSLLESTGLLVFFKGFGAEGFNKDSTSQYYVVGNNVTFNCSGNVVEQTAALAILKGEGKGMVRMVQVALSHCVIEVTLDELPAGEYLVNIHQLGDVSQGGNRYAVVGA